MSSIQEKYGAVMVGEPVSAPHHRSLQPFSVCGNITNHCHLSLGHFISPARLGAGRAGASGGREFWGFVE